MYSYPNYNNMPGPGDEATWPAYAEHPNDPRNPAMCAEEAEQLIEELYANAAENLETLDVAIVESFEEAPSAVIRMLSKTILTDDEAEVGHLVIKIVKKYCAEESWDDE